ncbi:class I SAM-dependent methyltransferase [Actinomycetospora sp. OC33-EN08]|uniref:Class I SAM-dependent methyltransferase n=1 Tax=Actinomycetospora aurantiaca TaxID=3129233 RepID=A0ABU8MN79_9PSEU
MTDIDEDTAREWLERWEVQQAGYVPDRNAVFALMGDVIERLAGGPRRIVDLGCGPGSLSARLLARFPDAEITAVDADPVMLALGRATLGYAVRWVSTDLRDDGWTDAVGVTGADAVVSSTALHWLPADGLAGFCRGVAALLRPGGVFLDFDTLLADADDAPRLAGAITDLRRERTEERIRTVREDFAAWWTAIEGEPGLAGPVAQRAAATKVGGHGGSTLRQWEDALRGAGFGEVGTVTQLLDRRLLVALRSKT